MYTECDLDQPHASKLPLAALVVTLVSISVSLVTMMMNYVTFEIDSQSYSFGYFDFYSYRYMVLCMWLGFAYTLRRIILAIYFLKTGKPLKIRWAFLNSDFYGDKVVSLALATAAGAAFGTTWDLKTNVDISGDELYGHDYKTKVDYFFNTAYISAGFLLIGFLSSVVSSIISSLAPTNNE